MKYNKVIILHIRLEESTLSARTITHSVLLHIALEKSALSAIIKCSGYWNCLLKNIWFLILKNQLIFC